MPEYIDKSVVLDQISKQKLFYEEERKQAIRRLFRRNELRWSRKRIDCVRRHYQ